MHNLPRGDFLIYDTEILHAIPPRDGSLRLDGVRYCNGWDDFPNMGVSVLAAYDGNTGEFVVTLGSDSDADGLTRFEDWAAQTTVLGFNSKGFDDNLLQAMGYEVETKFDILQQVRLASGQPHNYVRGLTRKGYNLDALGISNFNTGKVGGINGASAPALWQQGYKSQVINYCLNDVALCVKLLHKWAFDGFLVDPTDTQTRLHITDTAQPFTDFVANIR